jgi:hypothetical protein
MKPPEPTVDIIRGENFGHPVDFHVSRFYEAGQIRITVAANLPRLELRDGVICAFAAPCRERPKVGA